MRGNKGITFLYAHTFSAKAEEISDFADFVMKRFEEHRMTEQIQLITSSSQTFQFLNDEEDLYSETDVKEAYNG